MVKFPKDLPSKYYFSIGFKKYERPDPFQSLVTLTPVAGAESICLPVPGRLENSQDLDWEVASSLAGDALVNAGQGIESWYTGKPGPASGLAVAETAGIKSLGALAGGIGGIIGNLLGGPGGGHDVGGLFAGATNEATKSILQRVGKALNPVLTQQFTSPKFKTHQFTWKFAPDTPDESQDLENIINTIQYNALPDVEADGAFFDYPSIALIRIHNGGKDLYQIQECVVTNVTANYAPNGVPSFFAGTSLATEIQLTISLVEIILNTRKNTTLTGVVDDGSGTITGLNLSLNPNALATTAANAAKAILKIK